MTIELAVRAAVVLGAALVAARGLQRASAATRHASWKLVMAAVLLLPIIGAIAPSWSAFEWAGAAASPVPAAAERVLPEGAWAGDATRGAAVETRAGGADLTQAWLLIWGAGAGVIALYFAAGHLSLWRLRRRAALAPLPWSAAATRVAVRAGLARAPGVLVSPGVPGPLLAGLFRPAVFIPPDAAGWPESRIEPVLVHEIAHIARRDLQAHALAHAVAVVHWFNPLAWMAGRAMRRDQELACDDAVLASGVAPADYAGELLGIAAASLERRALVSALSMARPSEIEGRLMAVLGQRPRTRTAASRAAVPLAIALATTAVAGASVTRVPDRPSTDVLGTAPAIVNPPLVMGAAEDIDVPVRDDIEAAVTGRDAPVRERAVLRLALRSGTDVVPALIGALRDPDHRVREKAVVGLMWRRNEQVVPALIAAASDPDSRVREKAIVALALSGDERAGAAVAAARRDPDPGVREKAEKVGALR